MEELEVVTVEEEAVDTMVEAEKVICTVVEEDRAIAYLALV